MKKNGFIPIVIILVIAILGVVVYFGYKNFWPKSQPTENWKIFNNEIYNYQFKYPDNLSIGSNMGMDFSFDAITLDSNEETPPFMIQGVLKNDTKNISTYIGNPVSASDLIKTMYDRVIKNPNSYVKTVRSIDQTTFSGLQAYSFEVEASGVDYFYGEEIAPLSKYTYVVVEDVDFYILIIYGEYPVYNQIISTFIFTK